MFYNPDSDSKLNSLNITNYTPDNILAMYDERGEVYANKWSIEEFDYKDTTYLTTAHIVVNTLYDETGEPVEFILESDVIENFEHRVHAERSAEGWCVFEYRVEGNVITRINHCVASLDDCKYALINLCHGSFIDFGAMVDAMNNYHKG